MDLIELKKEYDRLSILNIRHELTVNGKQLLKEIKYVLKQMKDE